MPAIGTKKQEEQKPKFDLDTLIKSQNTEENSLYVVALYGFDDTAKTGMAFEILNMEDNKGTDKYLFVFDLDMSAIPIKKFWNDDKRIICIDPTILYETGKRAGERDPESTIENIRNIIIDIKNRDPTTIAGVIFDGCDVLKSMAGEFMLEEVVGLDVYSSGKTLGEASKRGDFRRTDYGVREKKYNTVINLFKYCKFPVILITHMKEKMEMKTDENGKKDLQITGSYIDWGGWTKAQMFQRILCEKVEEKDKIIWKATIQKSKGNPALTGHEYIIMEKEAKSDKYTWFGFNWDIFR